MKTSIVLDAVQFMIDAHGKQTRKGEGGAPYWTHPFRVWQLTSRVLSISDDTIECASLLHDVVEDTDLTAHDIQAFFGKDVAKIVVELTNEGSLPKRKKKTLMIKKALHIDNRSRIIKCFDRIDNLDSAPEAFSPKGVWYYVKESVLLHRNLRSGIVDDEWAEKAKKAVELLETTIDEVASFCYTDLEVEESRQYRTMDVDWWSDLHRPTN